MRSYPESATARNAIPRKKQVDPQKCLACHRDLAERIKAKRGWHRNKADGCIACHPEHHGEDFKLIDWDMKKFSHDETGFPLSGLHKKMTDCAACHRTANALPQEKKEKPSCSGMRAARPVIPIPIAGNWESNAPAAIPWKSLSNRLSSTMGKAGFP